MKHPNDPFITYEEYLKMRNESNELLEYVDGVIYMSPSPSISHQRISMKLSVLLGNLLDGSKCEVFAAPTDIQLTTEESDEKKIVIPDLSVVCDPSGFTEQTYIGIPKLIIEIISPSNQAHDLVFKLNLYQKYKVQEYWIVNPLVKTIMVYSLNEQDQYEMIAAGQKGLIESNIIDSFVVDIEKIFSL